MLLHSITLKTPWTNVKSDMAFHGEKGHGYDARSPLLVRSLHLLPSRYKWKMPCKIRATAVWRFATVIISNVQVAGRWVDDIVISNGPW
ncbi:hypothetical protein M758_1G229600 [Ceratodon purpureus]|nr:hypothetical protein M758_1G229600 [Ceratodon purpureus]